MDAPITRFDLDAVRRLRRLIEEAVGPELEGTGVSFRLGAIRFGADEARATLTLKVVPAADGENADPYMAAYVRWAATLGMRPEWLGGVFEADTGRRYMLTGWDDAKTRKKYRVLLLELSSGKGIRSTKDWALRQIERHVRLKGGLDNV